MCKKYILQTTYVLFAQSKICCMCLNTILVGKWYYFVGLKWRHTHLLLQVSACKCTDNYTVDSVLCHLSHGLMLLILYQSYYSCQGNSVRLFEFHVLHVSAVVIYILMYSCLLWLTRPANFKQILCGGDF